MNNTIIVTGGAGFIGSNFIHYFLQHHQDNIINLDKLTYAGNLDNLSAVMKHKRYEFIHGDINNYDLVLNLLQKEKPRAIIHFAAESHVDRSILGPESFMQANVMGTFQLLQAALKYRDTLENNSKSEFRFLHVSTDEVYGELEFTDPPFTEASCYQPNSPYAASKASSDHLVRAFYKTYQLPMLMTHCSNNYGPYQFPEKLIPVMFLNGLNKKNLPLYGDGSNIRDWLHVTDHCRALCMVLQLGRVGNCYNIGGECEKSNRDMLTLICELLDEYDNSIQHASLITKVSDRKGHDKRYAINIKKIKSELNWQPEIKLEQGLRDTLNWYISNKEWLARVQSGEYQQWLAMNYEQREE